MDTDVLEGSTISYPASYLMRDGRPFLLRQAKSQDRDCIIRNINEIGAEKEFFPSNYYVPTPAWEIALNTDAGNGQTYLLIVAEAENGIIGHGRLFPGGFGHKDGHVIDTGISLLRTHRELGIGTILLNCLIGWARITGFKKLTADIMSTNHRALMFFLQFGFVEEGRRYRQFIVDDGYADQIFVSKFLC